MVVCTGVRLAFSDDETVETDDDDGVGAAPELRDDRLFGCSFIEMPFLKICKRKMKLVVPMKLNRKISIFSTIDHCHSISLQMLYKNSFFV